MQNRMVLMSDPANMFTQDIEYRADELKICTVTGNNKFFSNPGGIR